jgi:hypothetical protein
MRVNQIFIGCPWENIRAKYEQVCLEIENIYPVDFIILGREPGQDAEGLIDVIMQKIEESESAVFDASGGNPNVSLEFGYCEALGKRKIITLFNHGRYVPRTGGRGSEHAIISDLAGKIRNSYKTTVGLKRILLAHIEKNGYVARFKIACTKERWGKRAQKLAAKIIKLSGRRSRVTLPDLISEIGGLFPNKPDNEIYTKIQTLKKHRLLEISRGPHGGVSIPELPTS